MGYTYLDHATDVIVEVRARNMDEALAYAAESIADITLDISTVNENETRPIKACGNNMQLALLDWLEAVNYAIITDGFAPRRFEAHVDGSGPYRVRGTAHGEGLDIYKHKFKIEVKAPTLHAMEISPSPGCVLLRFLLDL